MSRSKRHAPFIGIAGHSEKKDKRLYNRKFRRIVRERLRRGYFDLPLLREISNVWAMDKDGKRRFDAQKWPWLMRK